MSDSWRIRVTDRLDRRCCPGRPAAGSNTRTRLCDPWHAWLPASRLAARNCILAVSPIVPQRATRPCPNSAVIAPPADWVGARRRRRNAMITNKALGRSKPSR